MARHEYKLTDDQLTCLLNASRPVPYIVFGGIVPQSLQENVNEVWRRLGNEMGFQYMTAQPVLGKSNSYFTAEPALQPDTEVGRE